MRPTERWRQIVRARQEQMDAAYAALGRTSADYWARRAPRFGVSRPVAPADDPIVAQIAALAGPAGTVLDVGAGTGRYALALAPLVGQVVAIEPAASMADRLRAGADAAGLTNLDLRVESWEAATIAPADVVLCANVLSPIADVVPFIEKLDAHATRAVVLVLAVSWAEPPLLADLWRRYHGDERHGQAEAFDLVAVLRGLGIPPNVRVYPAPPMAMWTFSDLDEAVAAVREHVILAEDSERDAELRAAIAADARPLPDGRFALPQPERSVACIWWEREGPRCPPLPPTT